MHFGQVRRAAIAVVLFTVLLSFSPSARAQSEKLIVPGVSIGPARLGMTESEVYSLLGEPQSSFIGEQATIYNYPTFDVLVDNRSHTVVRLSTGSSIYATKENIRVGSSMLEVAAKLGAHTGCNFSVGCTFWYKGLGVQASTAAIVTAFWVLKDSRWTP